MALLILVAMFLLLQWITALLSPPALSLPAPHARAAFAVDLALPDIQGQIVRLADFHGRPVLVNFWATWCYPCRVEMPSMQALYKDYHDKGFVILAIATDIDGLEVVAPFTREYGLTFPVLLDPRHDVGSRLSIPGLPTSYLLDKQGRIVGLEIGARNWHSQPIRQLIEQLLAEDSRNPTP